MNKVILSLLAGVFTLGTLQAADPVSEIKITTDKQQFLYDIKEFTVKAGTTLKLTLIVPADAIPQPHNLVIALPGKEAALVQSAMAMMADPQGLQKGYLPDDKSDILAYTKLLNPGEEQTIEVEIPEETGDYPYLCTFPGHFAIMKGVMHVVE